MIEQVSFKWLVQRAVLRDVSQIVIDQVSVSDQMAPSGFNGIFCAIFLGWSGNSLYIVSVNDQEFNSFRRKTRSKASHDFRLLHR